jgi:hypothetical protein
MSQSVGMVPIGHRPVRAERIRVGDRVWTEAIRKQLPVENGRVGERRLGSTIQAE